MRRHTFNTTNIHTFWCHQIEVFPVSLISLARFPVARNGISICEHAISILADVKTQRTGFHVKMTWGLPYL